MTKQQLARWLQEERNTILLAWQGNQSTNQTLKKYSIDTEYFVRNFGSKVLDYFIDVIESKKPAGECPAIMSMLFFFKKKKIRLQDIYICCSAFKNTVLKLSMKNSSFTNIDDVFDTVTSVFDTNFSGVIHEYINHSYCLSECPKEEFVGKFQPARKKQLISVTPTTAKSMNIYATEYESEDVHEFLELEDDIVILVENIHATQFESSVVFELSKKLIKYGSIILTNPSFHKLGDSLINFGRMFEKAMKEDEYFTHKLQSITVMLDCFINDLIVWRKSLLVTGIEDMHYYDQSIISNIHQISAILNGDGNTAEDEIEFF